LAKILFVVPFLSGGGAERVASVWTGELAGRGADIHILLFYRTKDEYPLDESVKLHVIARSRKAYRRMGRLQKMIGFRRAIRQIDPDIVLPFVTYVGIMTMFARVGLPARVVETIRIDPRYDPENPGLRLLRNCAVLFANRCIVQTGSQLAYFPKALQKRISVIENPISPLFLKEGKVFGENKIKNLAAVGRLEKQKNYPMLIRAFSIVAAGDPDLGLCIYGEGSLLADLNEMICALGLAGRVRLCGRTEDVAGELLKADLFVLSSDAEGMPNALIEAMALGLPCISTDCPTGPSDIIQDGVNGYLVPVGDTEMLARTIRKVIDNAARSVWMGKNARTSIQKNFDAKRSACKLMDLLESI
jgi:glycosyltransferase involved in cell wall biosynthesis